MCIFKSSNSFAIYEYFFIASTMEQDSSNKHRFLLVAFLLGLSLVLAKVHALVIGETISNALSNV
jgi:hypothetical protein